MIRKPLSPVVIAGIVCGRTRILDCDACQATRQASGFGQTALTACKAVKNLQKAVKIGKKKKYIKSAAGAWLAVSASAAGATWYNLYFY